MAYLVFSDGEAPGAFSVGVLQPDYRSCRSLGRLVVQSRHQSVESGAAQRKSRLQNDGKISKLTGVNCLTVDKLS